MSNASILASRRGGDVLIADEPTRVEFTWNDVRSGDGEMFRITWSASVACVDSAADRALLAERFFGDTAATLVAARVGSDLSDAMSPAVRAMASATTADALLLASEATSKAIESAARSAAFAAGLAILPPFRLNVSSPSRDRERRLTEARGRLAALAEHDDVRARSLADATRVLIEAAGDASRATRAIASLRLADPLDVLRASAIVEPSWSSATPALWIVAGTRLARVDPLRATLDVKAAASIGDGLGPLRSINVATIDGDAVLLIGARDGVHVVSTADDRSRVVRSFRRPTGSEFGFNAACFVPADRAIVATHSKAGVVRWSWDSESAPEVFAVDGGARSAVALVERTVLLIADGLLATFANGAVVPMVGSARSMTATLEGPDGITRTKLVRDDADANARYGRAVGVEDLIDVAGVGRTVRPLAAGGLEMIDIAGAMPLTIGPANLAARSVAARPGFVAAVSVDRMRISLIDLSRPQAVAAELHVAATLGSRVADAAFA